MTKKSGNALRKTLAGNGKSRKKTKQPFRSIMEIRTFSELEFLDRNAEFFLKKFQLRNNLDAENDYRTHH